METSNLIDRIYYYYKDIAKVIYSYYENKPYVPEEIDVTDFISMCEKHLIDKYPSILFNFLERNDVRLGIIDKFVTNQHQYQVLYMDSLIVGTDCKSRNEAECRAIMASIGLLNKEMSNGKTIKYTK